MWITVEYIDKFSPIDTVDMSQQAPVERLGQHRPDEDLRIRPRGDQELLRAGVAHGEHLAAVALQAAHKAAIAWIPKLAWCSAAVKCYYLT